MPAFDAGLTSSRDSASRRDYEQAQVKHTQEFDDLRKQIFGQEQQTQKEDQLVNDYLMKLMRTFASGQDQQQPSPQPSPPSIPITGQPPPPGVGSPPMMGAAPPMAPGMGGGMPAAFGPQSSPQASMGMNMMQRLMQGGPGAGGGAPPPPLGVGGPPAQGPAPVGPQGPAAPPQGTPQGGMPSPVQGWVPGATAKPDLGGGLGPSGQGIMPRQVPSVGQITAQMDKMNIPPNLQYKVLSKAWPMLERENKEAMDKLKMQAELWNAGAAAMRAQKALQDESRGPKPDPEIARTVFAAGGNPALPLDQQPPGVVEKARKMAAAEEGRKGRTTINVGGGGEGKAPSGYRWSKDNKGELEAIPGGPADPSVVAAKKNAIQITGGRESVYTNRVMQAANQASRDLANIVKLPVSAQTTGLFGGRHQGAGLIDATKEVLAQKMTTQEAQTYNVMATGLQRTLAAVETSGLAQGIQEFSKQIDVVAKEGETNLTKLHKLAQVRQIIEAGMDPILVNPRVTEEQKALVKKTLDNVHAAVPFTHSDLIELTARQEADSNTTLKDVLQKQGGGSSILEQADKIIGK
jgi:hypothetical protein